MPLDEDGNWARRPWWRDQTLWHMGLYLVLQLCAAVLIVGNALAGWPEWWFYIPVGMMPLQVLWMWSIKRGRRGSAGRT